MKWKHLLMTMSICLFLANPARVCGEKLEAPQQAWKIAGMPLRDVYELLPVGDQAFAIGRNVDQHNVLLGFEGSYEKLIFMVRIEAPEFGNIRTASSLRLGLVRIHDDDQGGGQGIEYLVLLVVADDTTPYYEQYETWLYLWPLQSGGKALGELQKIRLGETSVATREEDPSGRWVYIAAPRRERGATGEPRPGFRTFVRVLVGDRNGDGYQDLILWSRICESRELAELPDDAQGAYCSPPFKMEQQVKVLPFSPEDQRFGPAIEGGGPVPPDQLWKEGMTVTPYGEPTYY